MTDITETSQTVAAGQLRAFVDRILRLKEEQDTIGDDVKEVYAELKGVGFDRTAVGALVTELRKKSKNVAAFEELNTILDLYRAAYEDGGKKPQAHARARAREIIEEFPPHDAETGEIIEQNSSATAIEMDRAEDGSFETGIVAAENRLEANPAGPVAGEVSHAGAGESPAADERYVEATVEQRSSAIETHERPSINDEASPEAGPQAEASLAGTGTGTLAGHEGRSEGEAASADLPAHSNSSDLTSSPETTDTAGAEPPPSAPATHSGSVAAPAPQAQPATKEAGADPLAAPANHSEIPDRATPGDDGHPSKPSPEVARAKNDDPHQIVVGQGAIGQGNSGRAVTISDADVPAFLKKAPSPAPNPDCQKPQSCRWSHSQASCAKCANDAAIARQRGRAA